MRFERASPCFLRGCLSFLHYWALLEAFYAVCSLERGFGGVLGRLSAMLGLGLGVGEQDEAWLLRILACFCGCAALRGGGVFRFLARVCVFWRFLAVLCVWPAFCFLRSFCEKTDFALNILFLRCCLRVFNDGKTVKIDQKRPFFCNFSFFADFFEKLPKNGYFETRLFLLNKVKLLHFSKLQNVV